MNTANRITDLELSIELMKKLLAWSKLRNDRLLKQQLGYMRSELSLLKVFKTKQGVKNVS